MRAILEAVTLEMGGTVAPRPAPGRKGEKKKRRGPYRRRSAKPGQNEPGNQRLDLKQ